MEVLKHHIYEYKKGIRNLILHTCAKSEEEEVNCLLKRSGIDFIIRSVGDKKINIFFGDKRCVEVVKRIGDKELYQFSDEEDFILGIMLGYDVCRQCERYIKRSACRNENSIQLLSA